MLLRDRPQSNQRGIETLRSIWSKGSVKQALPQSNQRGIETLIQEASIPQRPRLNRTSVGLKLSFVEGPTLTDRGLNRTSVGLKRGSPWDPPGGAKLPQSNQRGIETVAVLVGLVAGLGPQSNQRGIETGDVALAHGALRPPQSNQRGIETLPRAVVEAWRARASIEPAWD